METRAKRRQRLGGGGWRSVLKRFDESGVDVREFCEREGLGQASFYRWRRRLSDKPSREMAEAPHEAPDGAVADRLAMVLLQPTANGGDFHAGLP